MTYFTKFPNIVYEFEGKETAVKDILRRANFISEYKPYTDLYTPYTIVDGDTPQSLGLRHYGASTYHWVVLIFNEIHDAYFEWPLDTYSLIRMCVEKYGTDVMYQARHQELNGVAVGEIKEFVKGITWVPPAQVGMSVPVSFFEWESRINDTHRVIRIMRPELLSDFVSQFESAINV